MRGSSLAAAMACAILGAGTMIAGRADAITLAGQGPSQNPTHYLK
jgi:hypothetical protein